ncbi:2-oxoacid:acceptor oxidoreductase family protein [Aneurinibacillus tyrosinisolvens]|uniref:2-oxoacid:acceptor oxidoreductase family protein n=1 Tax=Aneurinibacillus tyrosinisolvens TaxID=1443435 RepID=UPI00063F592C|nr:2-oxoacid:acceptor oxidoreductase family protein [Aneurinibacillus tyrosinisolvens]
MKVVALFGLTGQGIETAGEILSAILQEQGRAFRTWRDFSTIIRGGYTSYEIYLTEEKEEIPPPRLQTVDLAVVWDDEGAARYLPRLRDNDLLFGPSESKLVPIENQEKSPKLGFNVWALGIAAGYIGLPYEQVRKALESRFSDKSNLLLLDNGYKRGGTKNNGSIINKSDVEYVTLSGNDALSLSAVSGGVRHYFGYPITPASEILEYLSKWLPSLGGRAYQVEDEIAAIHAAVGASFAGKRTFVATSGPGLSLMTEGMSYIGATEIPLVIVDNQRGGPSTGMPTKTEQSDLFHLYYSGHGEFSRILLTPTGVLDCLLVMQEALNLADYYQCPVIIALDLDLALRRISVPWYLVEDSLRSVAIDRGPTLIESPPLQEYKRYESIEGQPPIRTTPGIKGGAYVASGDEHDERGWMEPDFQKVRHTLHQRRLHKADQIDYNRPFTVVGNPKATTAIIGTGSLGELIEAIVRRNPEEFCGILLRQLCPLPEYELSEILSGVGKIVVAEYNARGQIRFFLEPVLKDKNASSLLRFDGEHYTLEEFETAIRDSVNNITTTVFID